MLTGSTERSFGRHTKRPTFVLLSFLHITYFILPLSELCVK